MTANFHGQAPLSFGESLSRFFGRLGVRSNAGLNRPIFNNCQPFFLKKCILLLLHPQEKDEFGMRPKKILKMFNQAFENNFLNESIMQKIC